MRALQLSSRVFHMCDGRDVTRSGAAAHAARRDVIRLTCVGSLVRLPLCRCRGAGQLARSASATLHLPLHAQFLSSFATLRMASDAESVQRVRGSLAAVGDGTGDVRSQADKAVPPGFSSGELHARSAVLSLRASCLLSSSTALTVNEKRRLDLLCLLLAALLFQGTTRWPT